MSKIYGLKLHMRKSNQLKKDVWKLADLSKKRNRIDTNWVYKLKQDQIGNVKCCNARLVTKVFYLPRSNDKDFKETCVPVANTVTPRINTLNIGMGQKYKD